MAPRRYRAALLSWLAVYPTITVLLAASEAALHGLPLPLRTLIVTAIMVPTTAFVAQPLVTRLADRLAFKRSPSSRHP